MGFILFLVLASVLAIGLSTLCPGRGGCGAQAESGGRCFRKEGLLSKPPWNHSFADDVNSIEEVFLVDFMLMLFLDMLGNVVDVCNVHS